ncbi:MAG: single-stranded-DNA-specific exonuclease RecJ [Coriobacteriia bacterium]|nr:single-stranded-DNA-specific exonuclease RecJ [Coriobacteriia bacterium]
MSLLSKVVESRGIEDFDKFLNPQWSNPYEIEGMEEVADAVETAIRAEKSILIYGDYDLDGMSATTVMLRGIREIMKYMAYDFKLDYFIPDRFSEGYGLSEKSIARMPECDVVITVDCGITSKHEVELLREKGIDVIITDHHKPGDSIPEGVPLVDPNNELAGVGVALKLIQSLCTRFGIPHAWEELTDIAMLGTIADVMPLTGDNRALVLDGLTKNRTCIRAICDVSGKTVNSATDLSFSVIPRLNSAGRLGKTSLAIKLLNSDEYSECYALAMELENTNTERQEITDDIYNKASFQAKNIISNNPDTKFMVVSGDNWHEGVIGIVASRIANDFNLPTIVFSIKGDEAHGSGRSVGDVDLFEIISSLSDDLVKFGGHKGACGLTINADKINELRDKLNNLVNPDLLSSKVTYDCDINLSELTINDVAELAVLEPFGEGNTEPSFFAKNVFIKNAKAVGAEHNHLCCQITDGNSRYQAIMFNCRDIDKILSSETTINAVFNARAEEFRGYTSVKLYLQSLDAVEVNDEVIEESIDEPKEEKINLEGLNHEELKSALLEAMIGKDGKLHDSQQQALDMLDEGKSGLAVMPTGRGKSLIFQLYASLIAIEQHKMSLFVYPLRALISDQAYHLEQMFSRFGLKSVVLNGESPQETRVEVYKQMRDREVDIVLTTPEFLEIHVDEFSNIGFIVIDECHHLGDVKIGQRTAYASMPNILAKFGDPQVLALSATVDDDILVDIKEYLPITKVIVDNFSRENLYVDDKRNIKDKDDYLVNLVATGEKTVIYANSRQQTIDLARMIKSRAPHIAMKVGYYNAGMSKADRKRIETLFRDNKLSVLIATSAFGEGVNIPDIRHVCLYHLPFSAVEFNQMSGRCGRDGADSIVHLIYNSGDAAINEKILSGTNPGRDDLAKAYTWIRNQGESAVVDFENPAFDIFSELGLIDVDKDFDGDKPKLTIKLKDNGRVELENSSRYCEGQNEITAFSQYKKIAMDMNAEELTELLRHPIKPEV